jgi:hypothetical protein
MSDRHWILVSLSCLLLGWFASVWAGKRRIRRLRQQIDALRQTASEHSNQARRQIGQLQADLASRPPRLATVHERRAAATLARSAAGNARRGVSDDARSQHGFAATTVMPEGFAPTVISPEGFADTQVFN